MSCLYFYCKLPLLIQGKLRRQINLILSYLILLVRPRAWTASFTPPPPFQSTLSCVCDDDDDDDDYDDDDVCDCFTYVCCHLHAHVCLRSSTLTRNTIAKPVTGKLVREKKQALGMSSKTSTVYHLQLLRPIDNGDHLAQILPSPLGGLFATFTS